MNIELDDKKKVIYDNTNGYWTYNVEIDLDKEGFNVPSDNEAAKIATDLLKKAGLYNQYICKTIVTNGTTGDALVGTEKILRKNVYFYPQVEGKNIYGVFRIMVSVGNNGEVVGISKQMNDLERYKKVKLKSKDRLIEDVNNKNYSSSMSIPLESATISNCELAYYAEPESITVKPYLQPVFVLHGKGIDLETKEEQTFDDMSIKYVSQISSNLHNILL